MKRRGMMILLALAGAVSMAVAAPSTTIIDTGFTTADGWANGDATQNGWFEVPNTGTNAFTIIDAEGNGYLDTFTASYQSNGNYIYTAGAGNDVDDEYAGVMDFTFGTTSNYFEDGDTFRIGLSTDINTNFYNGATNQVYLRVHVNANGSVQLRGATVSGGTALMLQIEPEVVGWNTNLNNSLTSDNWRLTWTMRKTRTALAGAGYYSLSCDMENLDNPTNFTGETVLVQKIDVYDYADPVVMMGRTEGASFNNDIDLLEITIDELRYVKNAGVGPTLYPTAVSAGAGDTVVDLGWDHVVEAESYDVKRSDTIDGTYATLASAITTNGYQDLTVVNGNVYYYIVTSKATDAADADSVPVLAEPDEAKTGTIIDTTFAATDTPPYADGDLAGQNNWRAPAFAGAPAFNVDSAGDGFAETATFAADFDDTDGNAVYFNKFSSNTVNAAWSGTMVFTMINNPEPGNFKTNIAEIVDGGVTNSVTNFYEIANVTGDRILNFGLTDDPNGSFKPNNGGDVMVTVRTQGDGDLEICLNGRNGLQRMMHLLSRNTVGWDPQWANPTPSNAPNFETDPITLDWTIRKTAVSNDYMCAVDVTVGTNTFTSFPVYISDDAADTASHPINVWPADLAYFFLFHDNAALQAGNVEIRHVSIDSLSVTHTNYAFQTVAPHDLAYLRGDLEIALSWKGSPEADSYEVWKADGVSASGPYTLIASNLTAAAYTDTGLIDKHTYFYKVVAKYLDAVTGAGDMDSDESDVLIVRALGVLIQEDAHWGKSWDIVGGNVNFARTADTLVGSVYFSKGNGPDGELAYVGLSSYDEQSLYGVFQLSTNNTWSQLRTYNRSSAQAPGDVIQVSKSGSNSDGTYYSCLVYIKPAAPLDAVATDYNIKIAVNNNSVIGMHAAIHNDGKWYASSSSFATTGDFIIPSITGETWAEVQIADNTMTNLMVMPTNFVEGTALSLTGIDAVGYFIAEDPAGVHQVNEIRVASGTLENAFDLWSNDLGLYNENQVLEGDPDNDGINNLWEWGLGGDPLDPDSYGLPAEYLGLQMGETNYIVYLYTRTRYGGSNDRRPAHFLVETDNLVFTPFVQSTNYIQTGAAFDANFWTHTNLVPVTSDQKFIKLEFEWSE